MARYKYRTFNHKRYRQSDTTWATKASAQKFAKKMRRSGYAIRITSIRVNGQTRYVTWAREK